MTAICVDDEPLVLQLSLSLIRELPQFEQVEGFGGSVEALDWLETHRPDLALLDIDMPAINGIALAIRIKEQYPDTAMIFLTGYTQYAVEAFALHASGYLMKPINREKLSAEVEYALSGRHARRSSHIQVQTFGNFDVFVDGKAVAFNRSKSKELLAYLVDRKGSSVSRTEAFAVLWEDNAYDRSMQKQLDVVIRSLRGTLQENGIGEILEMKSGNMRIVPELLDCDLYRFFSGDAEAINEYRGEYMSSYSWASLTEANVDRHLRNYET